MRSRRGRARAAVFDLDGTLVRCGGAGRLALDAAVLALHGVPGVCSTISLAGRMDGENFRLALRNATGREPSRAGVAALEAAYAARLPAAVRSAVRSGRYAQVPGCFRLLLALKRRGGFLVGLGTGNLERGAVVKLGPSGLLRFFSFGAFGTDGRTRERMLAAAIRRASALAGAPLRPRDVFVIGDTPRDVEAGKAAGCMTGAVTSGYGGREALLAARPDFIRPDYRDLDAWLGWLEA